MDEKDEVAETPITSNVKWYSAEKGYGFIKLPGGGADIFVHANQLERSGITRALEKGEKVQFMTSRGPKGAFEVDVKLFDNKE